MDKQQIISEIGKLESSVTLTERKLLELENKSKRSRSNYIGGVIGILLGIIILIFIWWPLGVIFIIAGILAVITGSIDQWLTRRETQRVETDLANQRGKLAELRAQLLI